MKRSFFLLTVLFFIGAGCTRTSSSPQVNIGSSHFGRVVDDSSSKKNINGGWVRPFPGPFWWDQIETSQDVYDWSKTDQMVRNWQERDQAILVTLWPFAQWDQERCHAKEAKVKHPFIDKQVWLSGVCHVESYQDWIGEVVERYDGDGVEDMPELKYPITHWEISYEPDLHSQQETYFQYAPAAYAELYRLAYEVMKKTDPNSVVVLAGMSGMTPQAQVYWKEVLNIEKSRATLFNIHSHGASEQFFSKEYHEFLDQRRFFNPRYWITHATVGSLFQKWDEEQMAKMTLIGYVQAFANGAEKIFYAAPAENATLSEKTFQLVVNTIDGFEKAEWPGPESLVKFTFSDKTVYALWDSVTLPNEVGGEVEVLKYNGERTRVNAREVKADDPLFVIVK